MWFRQLFGFDEGGWAETQRQFQCDGEWLDCLANGRRFAIGRFGTPSLAGLRRATATSARGRLTWQHSVIGDVLELHADPAHQGAMFQVASQFNCLEFADPWQQPEDGIAGYAGDNTQGPACALAAAAATVYRNYWVPLDGACGQTTARQIDNLAGLAALAPEPLFTVRNGYTSATAQQLARLDQWVERADREALLGAIRIGVQSGVGVTFSARWREPVVPQTVSQAFCSAVSCAYTDVPTLLWAPLATLALDAAYEATLRAAALDLAQGRGSGTVWLTSLGGGAFGNDRGWIAAAVGRALRVCRDLPLRVHIAHYRGLDRSYAAAIDGAAR